MAAGAVLLLLLTGGQVCCSVSAAVLGATGRCKQDHWAAGRPVVRIGRESSADSPASTSSINQSIELN